MVIAMDLVVGIIIIKKMFICNTRVYFDWI